MDSFNFLVWSFCTYGHNRGQVPGPLRDMAFVTMTKLSQECLDWALCCLTFSRNGIIETTKERKVLYSEEECYFRVCVKAIFRMEKAPSLLLNCTILRLSLGGSASLDLHRSWVRWHGPFRGGWAQRVGCRLSLATRVIRDKQPDVVNQLGSPGKQVHHCFG